MGCDDLEGGVVDRGVIVRLVRDGADDDEGDAALDGNLRHGRALHLAADRPELADDEVPLIHAVHELVAGCDAPLVHLGRWRCGMDGLHRKRTEGIEARNDADSFVFQTEMALKDVGDKIDAGAKATVEDDLKALKETLEQTKDKELSDSEIDQLKSQKEKLMNDAQALFAKVYEQAQGAAGAGGAGPDFSNMNMGGAAGDAGASSGSTGDDNVVDGDFREV